MYMELSCTIFPCIHTFRPDIIQKRYLQASMIRTVLFRYYVYTYTGNALYLKLLRYFFFTYRVTLQMGRLAISVSCDDKKKRFKYDPKGLRLWNSRSNSADITRNVESARIMFDTLLPIATSEADS